MSRHPDRKLPAAWQHRLERYRSWSGSIADFCRREGVSTASFFSWRRRLRDQATGEAAAAESQDEADPVREPAFVPVLVAPEPALSIQLGPATFRIAKADHELIRMVVREVALVASGEKASC